MLRSFMLVAAFACLAASGCGPGKLDVTKEFTLDGDPQILFLDPQPKPQNVTVEFESTGEIVVLLIKSSDIPQGEEGFVPTAKAIAFKKDKSGSFSGEVPANTATQVLARGGTKNTVKLRVHNQ
jgi:hypothetical protein